MTPDNEKIFVDPLKLDPLDMPMVVFEADNEGLISFLIRWVSGQYNHAMWITPKGFASQGLRFSYVPIKHYMRKGVKLKFFKIVDMTEEERAAIYTLIEKRVHAPWWRNNYDFLGIFGQFIGIRKLNNPWTTYCSEQMASDLTLTIVNIKGKPTPEELEEFVKVHPRFEYVGHWIGD